MEKDQAKAQLEQWKHRFNALFEQRLAHPQLTPSSGFTSSGFKIQSGKNASSREIDMVNTISVLKSALERASKGLEHGVSSTKYMAAVSKIKQLKGELEQSKCELQRCKEVMEQQGIDRVKIGELERLVVSLGHQLKAAKRHVKEQLSAREELLIGQIVELERAISERDVALAALRSSSKFSACESEDLQILAAYDLSPRQLVQFLLEAR